MWEHRFYLAFRSLSVGSVLSVLSPAPFFSEKKKCFLHQIFPFLPLPVLVFFQCF